MAVAGYTQPVSLTVDGAQAKSAASKLRHSVLGAHGRVPNYTRGDYHKVKKEGGIAIGSVIIQPDLRLCIVMYHNMVLCRIL